MIALRSLLLMIAFYLVKGNLTITYMRTELLMIDKKPSQELLKVLQVPSHIACIAACYMNGECESFVYDSPLCHLMTSIIQDRNDTNLTDAYGFAYYIAQRLFGKQQNQTSLTATTTTTATTIKQYELDLFYFGPNIKKKWSDAKTFCENKNARMVSIVNEQVQKEVEKLMEEKKENEGAWIGLQSTDRKGKFQWLDGTEIQVKNEKRINKPNNYQNWHQSNPDDFGKESNVPCRIIGRNYKDQKYTWTDEKSNDEQAAVICERQFGKPQNQASSTESPETTTTKQYNKLDLFYFETNTKKNWADAKKFCEEKNGRMVSIVNQSIQDKVEQLMGEKNEGKGAWIGLQSIDRDGNFQWLDGTKIQVSGEGVSINEENNYQKWHKSNPNDYKTVDAAPCRIIGSDYGDQKYTWTDEPLGDKQDAVICELN